ncbi:phosphatase PAP2 family protein [Streptomyces bluensis]|uniref:Phosphatase PAP2 family protein n=1 Tax=Streptomyces bluensis TaxID=33897 RepID=A0ABW6ULM8_9ACTN
MTLFALVAGAYVAVFVALLARSPLLRLDWRLAMWRPFRQWPELRELVDVLVVAGQRGPTMTMALAWLGWRYLRSRNPRPLLVFLAALGLLNVSVGAVKLGTGRLGPGSAYTIGSTEFLRGGDVFPSGHTANCLVTWGTLAHLASRHRTAAAVAAALAAVVVGLATVYLGTHWFSDVLGGWAAGALVLLALPYCEQFAERVVVRARRLGACLAPDPASRLGPGAAMGLRAAAVRGRRGSGGWAPPVVRAFTSRRLNPAATTAAFHPRVWNERGPPRVSDMSEFPTAFPWVGHSLVPGVSCVWCGGNELLGDAGRAGRGTRTTAEPWWRPGSRCSTTEITSGSSSSDRRGPRGGPTGPA